MRRAFQEKIEGLFIKEEGVRAGQARAQVPTAQVGRRCHEMSCVPWDHGMEEVNIGVTLLPPLFLPRASEKGNQVRTQEMSQTHIPPGG